METWRRRWRRCTARRWPCGTCSACSRASATRSPTRCSRPRWPPRARRSRWSASGALRPTVCWTPSFAHGVASRTRSSCWSASGALRLVCVPETLECRNSGNRTGNAHALHLAGILKLLLPGLCLLLSRPSPPAVCATWLSRPCGAVRAACRAAVTRALAADLATAANPARGGLVREALGAHFPRLAQLLEDALGRLARDTQARPRFYQGVRVQCLTRAAYSPPLRLQRLDLGRGWRTFPAWRAIRRHRASAPGFRFKVCSLTSAGARKAALRAALGGFVTAACLSCCRSRKRRSPIRSREAFCSLELQVRALLPRRSRARRRRSATPRRLRCWRQRRRSRTATWRPRWRA